MRWAILISLIIDYYQVYTTLVYYLFRIELISIARVLFYVPRKLRMTEIHNFSEIFFRFTFKFKMKKTSTDSLYKR